MPSSEQTDSSADRHDDSKHEKLDSGVRDMFSAITSRIFRVHNIGGSSTQPHHHHHHHGDGEDDRGIRVITLAGNNTGATLRDGQEDKTSGLSRDDDENAPGTYVNSNFQAVNNSIMMGGSYSANDPGVHAEIVDFVEDKHKHGKKDKKKKEKKKKEKAESV